MHHYIYGHVMQFSNVCSHGSELAELGSLWEHIQKSRGQPDMKLSLRWAVDIAEGAYNYYTHILLNTTVAAKLSVASMLLSASLSVMESHWLPYTFLDSLINEL